MRTSFSRLLPALLPLALALHPGCGGDEFSSEDPSAGGGGQSQAGQGGSSPGGAGNGQGGAGNGQSGSGTAGAGPGGSGDAGAGQAGSGIAGAGQAGSGNAGSGNAGSGNAGSGNAGSGQAGSGNAGSGQAGSGNAGSGNAGSGQAGSGQAGSGNGGSGVAGSGMAGSGQAGSGVAGSGGATGGCASNADCMVDVPNGSQVCDAGQCVAKCQDGFVNVGGVCRDFGGAYVLTNTGECKDANPFGDSDVNKGCSCVAGFQSFEYDNWPYALDHYGTMVICAPASPVGQYGGALVQNLTTGSCTNHNPYKGSCGCLVESDLPMADLTEANKVPAGQTFEMCLGKGKNYVPTIRGMFQKYADANTGTLVSATQNCIESSLDNGDCGCPPASIPNKISAVFSGQVKGNIGIYPTNIVICTTK